MKHPAVLMAAVVGSPDPAHRERVRPFVVAKSGVRRPPACPTRSALLSASVWHTIRHPGGRLSSGAAAHRDWEVHPPRVAHLAKRND